MIAITDALITHYQDEYKTLEAVIGFICRISDNPAISFDPIVANSEMAHGDRNLALARPMRSFGNFENDVQRTVMTYFKHCAITMSTKELSRTMLFLAFDGTDPISGTRFVTPPQAKRINAMMLTCGHYDASGKFAFYVGLPAKSGVCGGIVATDTGHYEYRRLVTRTQPLRQLACRHAGTGALYDQDGTLYLLKGIL